MTLLALIFLPLAGGLAAWIAGGFDARAPRWIALGTLAAHAAMALRLLRIALPVQGPAADPVWVRTFDAAWIPSLGIHFSLGADTLSALMIALTSFLGLAALGAGWRSFARGAGAYCFLLLASLAGVCGVFAATDLFLFFVFYEAMLIPMYFMIAMWGGKDGGPAAIKFTVFTQAGGLLLLIATIALAFVHGGPERAYTFAYTDLLRTAPGAAGVWMLGAFIAAFGVKLPIVPLHRWQPDTYGAAPVPAAIVLAGLMSKAGAYGLIRFAVPLFPAAARDLAPLAMGLGVVTILYGATLAYAQTDLRRIIAYSSLSHLGFVLLGAFSMNAAAYGGVVMTMLAHGVSVAGLFLVAGALEEQTGTRDIRELGGIFSVAPRSGALGLVFAFATLGMPGLGNFIGEFLVLLGTFRTHPVMAGFASLGMVLSAAYTLRLVRHVFFGPARAPKPFAGFDLAQGVTAALLAAALLILGLRPNHALDRLRPFWGAPPAAVRGSVIAQTDTTMGARP